MTFPHLQHKKGRLVALGLMSGTSLDGVDAALVCSDGGDHVECGAALTLKYGSGLRDRLRALLGTRREDWSDTVAEATHDCTLVHVRAVAALLLKARLKADRVDVIGFHGQTLNHCPQEGWSWQIGDGSLLATQTGIDVVNDFRSSDLAAGGQGAPFAPLYHGALAAKVEKPLVVLNLGGVANITWIGPVSDSGADSVGGSEIGLVENEILAFDTGPGNALINDWADRTMGRPYDANGALAAQGKVEEEALSQLLDHPFFDQKPPKSLDRNDFSLAPVEGLSAADGAATLTAFTAHSVARAREFFPAPPLQWLVAGGGRHNPVLMKALAKELTGEPGDAPAAGVKLVESAGWDGDALEAQAFAYLAVRSLKDLPLSLPATTGVSNPVSGGTLYRRGRGAVT
jgi:anhydro-N-acetylmuramic acid kinase